LKERGEMPICPLAARFRPLSPTGRDGREAPVRANPISPLFQNSQLTTHKHYLFH